MRVENWCGYDIRFVEVNGEWYAILKDICDALKLKTFDVSRRLSPDMMEKVRVYACDMGSNGVRIMCCTYDPEFEDQLAK